MKQLDIRDFSKEIPTGNFINPGDDRYYVRGLKHETCVLCGKKRGTIPFKNKRICIHCLEYVKSN